MAESMPLWKLAEEYRADVAKLQDLNLDPETVLDTIDSMQGDVLDKIKAVVIVAKELEALADARDAVAKATKESAASVRNRAQGLLSYAQIAMQNCGLALPLKYPEFTVNLQRNPQSCEVHDISKVPGDYIVSTVSVTINGRADLLVSGLSKVLSAIGHTGTHIDVSERVEKKPVLDKLKAGESIPGASLNPDSYRLTVK